MTSQLPALPRDWRLVPIAPGTKGPRTSGWNQRENTISVDQWDGASGIGLAHSFSKCAAFDIDDLEKTRETFPQVDDWLDAIDGVQVSSGTPNRAKLLFALDDPLPSVSAGAFELRCGTADGLTVQDLLPPSVHPSGRRYEWVMGPLSDLDRLPALPPELLNYWQQKLRPVEVEPATPTMSREQVTQLLDAIDPNPLQYDDWLRVGMAVHYELGKEAFELFDGWSQRTTRMQPPEKGGGPVYNRNKTRLSWKSFGKKEGITGNTLRRLAREQNERPSSADLFEVLPEEPEKVRKRKFMSRGLGEISIPDVAWHIKGVLPIAPLTTIYGEPGSGKSFLAIDLAMHIALGRDWGGHKVTQGPVMYLAAEGQEGIFKRFLAWAIHHGLNQKTLGEIPLEIITEAPNLTGELADLKKLLIQVKGTIERRGWGGLRGVIYIDTAARVTPGADENSSKDMGNFLMALEAIAAELGWTVVVVAHMGKDVTRGIRGWSGINAATDAAIAIERVNKAAVRTLNITKQKDGEDGARMRFSLLPVHVRRDRDGNTITSCVVKFDVAAEAIPEPSGDAQRKVLNTIRRLLEASEEPLTPRRLADDLRRQDLKPAADNLGRILDRLVQGRHIKRGGQGAISLADLQISASEILV